jgi:HTH-type transcriptional regulator/antitoxin HigA
MTQKSLANAMCFSAKHISELMNGKVRITAETAIKLEKVFGLEAEVWIRLQSDWDLRRAREAERAKGERAR